jgi:hypothetical protein
MASPHHHGYLMSCFGLRFNTVHLSLWRLFSNVFQADSSSCGMGDADAMARSMSHYCARHVALKIMYLGSRYIFYATLVSY